VARRTVPHQNRPRNRERLNSGGCVYKIPRYHALVFRADSHRGLTRKHSRARPELRQPHLDSQLAHALDQLQGGPHGAFGVVLLGRRRSPYGHHRVADELLDHPSVEGDEVARRFKIAAE
jgi:hypothetical protein